MQVDLVEHQLVPAKRPRGGSDEDGPGAASWIDRVRGIGSWLGSKRVRLLGR